MQNYKFYKITTRTVQKIVKLAIYIAKSDDDTAPMLKTQKYSLGCPFSHPRMNT